MAQLFGPARGSWRPLQPRQAEALLAGAEILTWIAGGWALALFVGSSSRPHKDLDIGVRRRDVGHLRNALPHWDFFEAKDGSLFSLGRGETPRLDVNSLWAKPSRSTDWELEFLLDESSDDEWIFRRDPSVRMPLQQALRIGEGGIRYLAPEIQLLYKARDLRPQDHADFERVLPRLAPAARGWLGQALNAQHQNHPWLDKL